VTLDAVGDQPRAAALLRRALATGRVAHAYAFVGPPGTGRTGTALAFAAALLCPRGGCGACRACAQVAERRHPDLHVIVPTPPESNPRGPRAIRIGAIRELERRAWLRPVAAERKVFVLDDADRMTEDAPQAFLKTLEEPPPRTVILLVLERVRAVPATIVSRCQLVRFQPPPAAPPAERAEALGWLEEVRRGGAEALFRLAQTVERDREAAERVVDALWFLCRDLALAKAGVGDERPGAGPGAALGEEARRWSWDDLWDGLAACREARRALAVNVTPRLTVEVLLSRLALGG
jgi:DNA polymerase-3 subunit delta'